MLDFYNVLTYLDILIYLVVITFMVFRFKKLEAILKVFALFAWLIFIIACTALVYAKLGKPNLRYFNALLFVQWVWLTAYYFSLFKGSRLGIVVGVVAIAASLYLGWHYYINWPQVLKEWGGKPYFITNILFVVYALAYYVYNINSKNRLPYPLINAGILVYYSTSSVIFLFSNYLMLIDRNKQVYLWIFNALLHIVFLLLLFIEIWKLHYPKKKALSH